MKNLVIVTGYNSPGKKDATGAFLPEAQAFIDLHGGSRLEIVTPNTTAKRRSTIEAAIRTEPDLEVLAVFGHGTPSALLATGHNMSTVSSLADAIRIGGARTVILYSCSTAAGVEGFADRLADKLPLVNVWAHTTAGHTTWNPNLELAGGQNHGDAIARFGDPLWKRWQERMRDDQAFRLSFWVPAHGQPRAQALEAVRKSV